MLRVWPSCTLDLSRLCSPGEDYDISMALPLERSGDASGCSRSTSGPMIHLRIVSYPVKFNKDRNLGSVDLGPVMSFLPEDNAVESSSRSFGDMSKELLAKAVKKMPRPHAPRLPSAGNIIQGPHKLYEVVVGSGKSKPPEPSLQVVQEGVSPGITEQDAPKPVQEPPADSSAQGTPLFQSMMELLSGRRTNGSGITDPGAAQQCTLQETDGTGGAAAEFSDACPERSYFSFDGSESAKQRVYEWDIQLSNDPEDGAVARQRIQAPGETPGADEDDSAPRLIVTLSRVWEQQAEGGTLPALPRPSPNDDAPGLEAISSLAVEVEQLDMCDEDDQGVDAAAPADEAGPRMAVSRPPSKHPNRSPHTPGSQRRSLLPEYR